jgi:hypothetical protein
MSTREVDKQNGPKNKSSFSVRGVTRTNIYKKPKNINFKKGKPFFSLVSLLFLPLSLPPCLPFNDWNPKTLCLSFFLPHSLSLLLALDFPLASGIQRPSAHSLITLVSLWCGVAKLLERLSVAKMGQVFVFEINSGGTL